MMTSSSSARRRYFDRSSFTSDSGTVFITPSYLLEPLVRVGFRHNGQDLDLVALDVIEDPQVFDAEPVLRIVPFPKAFDPALADLGRLVPQMDLHRVAHL